jgi:cytidine deaminase
MTITFESELIKKFSERRLFNSKGFGKYFHYSMIFTKKGGIAAPLSYGENQIRGKWSIHAEEDCINRIPIRDGKVQKVCLLVMRVTKHGDYTMSKPCMHCIEKMNGLIGKNYKITSVYYSNSSGDIEKCSLNQLNKDPCKHVSKLYKSPRTLR